MAPDLACFSTTNLLVIAVTLEMSELVKMTQTWMSAMEFDKLLIPSNVCAFGSPFSFP